MPPKATFPVTNTAHQPPGGIALPFDDRAGEPVQRQWAGLVTVFNATPIAVRLRVAGLSSRFACRIYSWQLSLNLVLPVVVTVIVHYGIERRFYPARSLT